MATDVAKGISANDIKNGTLVVSCTFTGEYGVYNRYVKNTPALSAIDSKYDNRFDDPSYYYGSSTDGGNV